MRDQSVDGRFGFDPGNHISCRDGVAFRNVIIAQREQFQKSERLLGFLKRANVLKHGARFAVLSDDQWLAVRREIGQHFGSIRLNIADRPDLLGVANFSLIDLN